MKGLSEASNSRYNNPMTTSNDIPLPKPPDNDELFDFSKKESSETVPVAPVTPPTLKMSIPQMARASLPTKAPLATIESPVAQVTSVPPKIETPTPGGPPIAQTQGELDSLSKMITEKVEVARNTGLSPSGRYSLGTNAEISPTAGQNMPEEEIKTVPPEIQPPPAMPIFGVPTIQTLKTDMSGALMSGSAPLARDALQDVIASNTGRSRLENILRALVIFFIVTFFAGGTGIAGYVFYKSRGPQTAGVIAEQGPAPLLSANTQSELDTTGKDGTGIRELLTSLVREKNGLLQQNGVELVHIVRRVIENEKTYILEVPMAQVLGLVAGESTARITPLLLPVSFFGLYNGKTLSSFILLKTSFFQETYAEMLDWETSLALDLYSLTTGETLPEELSGKDWEDQVIQNTDTRVLKDASNQIRMLYSFMGTSDTLFIGTSEEAFVEVLTRLKNPISASR